MKIFVTNFYRDVLIFFFPQALTFLRETVLVSVGLENVLERISKLQPDNV
jgi:hypothetical protein